MICHRVTINLGDSLFYIVLMWLLYDLTKDPFYTGMGGFMFSMADALNFFCGPIIDRCSKRWLLLITSAVQFFVLFGLYCLSANGTVHVPLLLLSIPVFDLMSKMTYSIHNTLIPILVKKEEWRTANTVLSITNTGIDLMFSAVAGVVLALFYLKTIFMVNSLINLAALVTAMFLFRKLSSKREFTDNETRTSVPSLKEVWKGYREDLKSGIILVKIKTILSLVVPLVGLSLFYAMMLVNLPAFSARIFGSAMGYGFMLTLLAVGSIAGALLSGQLTKRFRLGRLFPQLFVLGGVSWIFMSLFIESAPLLGAFFLVIASGSLGAVNIIFVTLFQQIPPQDMIARVNTVNLSLIAIASLCGSLLGGVIVKFSADFIPFLLCGVGYLLIGWIMRVNTRTKILPTIDKVQQNIL